ncbi:MAG: hypothetical protein AAFP84_02240, partial [Actinomycetota bacterium]
AKEDIAPRTPTTAERELAERVLAAEPVRRLGALHFARVDIAPNGDGGRDDPESLVVMELELVEPSFYFDHTPGSCAEFASAMLARLAVDRRRVDA